ncbi:hypothetical protein [Pararhizobium sp. LjRoot238]|uniref:hypothetical protein n=1 Tax=Pararhizobium sp. LjRoot238 TaxID=3342293 RepID=UPI003ED025C8
MGNLLAPGIVEKRQNDKRFEVEPVLGANVLRKGNIALGLRHVAEIEIVRRKA